MELGICLAGGWGGSISLNVLCGRLLIIITSILIVVGNLKEVFIINIFVILGGIYFSLLRKFNYDIFRTRNAKFRAFCVVRAGPGDPGS